MEAGEDYKAKKRERLLAIIDSEPPARKPGARLRTWENNRAEALRELRRLDSGKAEDEEPW